MNDALERQKHFSKLAGFLSEALSEIYGTEVGFLLVASPMNNGNVADYVGNTRPLGAVEWMRETADRIEKRETIPSVSSAMQ